MKKNIVVLSVLGLIAISCKLTTREQVKTKIESTEILEENIYTFSEEQIKTKIESTEILEENICTSSEQKYLIKNNGVDVFLIGQKIPAQADGYSITKSIETRTEEGTDFELPVYTVFEDGQAILNIEQFNHEIGTDSDKIGNIFILSEKFRTAENIGLHSTIEEFVAAYPDFTIWFSYISHIYVIETGQPFNGVQFFLDGNDFADEGGPEFDSDMTILELSDFKKGSKIKKIRIWGYGE